MQSGCHIRVVPSGQEKAMYKLRKNRLEKPRPRDVKRRRQWEAMLHTPLRALVFPEPEPPVWKPLG